MNYSVHDSSYLRPDSPEQVSQVSIDSCCHQEHLKLRMGEGPVCSARSQEYTAGKVCGGGDGERDGDDESAWTYHSQ
jgi:hypothetical protein